MKVKFAHWYIALEVGTRSFGLGWRNSTRFFARWHSHGPEGVTSGWRLGPLFYEHGPYWGAL